MRHPHRLSQNYSVIVLVTLLCAMLATPAHAAPLSQERAEALCMEGVRLYNRGRVDEAFPLLEAGFNSRDRSIFSVPDNLATCALVLGRILSSRGDPKGALDVYMIALPIFQATGERIGESSTLGNIGEALYFLESYGESLDYLEKALEIRRELADPAGIGEILHSMGVTHLSLGNYTEALDYLSQALAIRIKLSDTFGQGQTLNSIGVVYQSQGRYNEALDYHKQALIARRKAGDRKGEGTSINNIAVTYETLSRYYEAVYYFKYALLIVQEIGDRKNEGTTLNNIGEVYRHQGRDKEALDYFEQALRVAQDIGSLVNEGTVLNNLGLLYKDTGRPDGALEYFKKALAISQKLGNRLGEGRTTHNMGRIYQSQGRFSEALNYFLPALHIFNEIGDQEYKGIVLNDIGLMYAYQGDYSAALEYYQQALGIRREVGDLYGEATTLNNIGTAYIGQTRYIEALEQFQHALQIVRKLDNIRTEGVIINNIAMVYDFQRNYAEALKQYQYVLQIMREINDQSGEAIALVNIGKMYWFYLRFDEALEALNQALLISREIDNQHSEAAALKGIASVYYLQGRHTEAIKYNQESLAVFRNISDNTNMIGALSDIAMIYQTQNRFTDAISFYEQSMEILEGVRAKSGGDQVRINFISQYAFIYTEIIKLYYQQGQPDLAFATAERGRARAFLDSLVTGVVELSDREANALFQQEREAYAVRQAAQDAMIKARTAAEPDAVLIRDLEQQLAQAETAYAEVQKAIAERGDNLQSLVSARKDTTLSREQVQSYLDPDTTLVSYFVGEEATLAFVLTQDAFHVEKLAIGREELNTQVSIFRSFNDPDAAQTLYTALIAPLKPHLTTRYLLIVPHDVLHYLPFAALSDGQQALIENYTLTSLPAASVLPFIKSSEQPTGEVLVLANRTHPDNPRPALGLVQAAQIVGTLFGVEPLLNTDATEDALRNRVPDSRIVHIGAHGIFNTVAPLESALLLAPQGNDDGRLTTGEVYGLDLKQADLVVLSGCETLTDQRANPNAPSSVTAGDELVGLTRAFFYAGTPTVIATLWQVDDTASQALLERFYTHLRAGVSKAEALRLAQQELKAEGRPVTEWAGFVLVGDGGKIGSPTTAQPWGLWAGVGAVLLVVARGAYWWRRRQEPVTQESSYTAEPLPTPSVEHSASD